MSTPNPLPGSTQVRAGSGSADSGIPFATGAWVIRVTIHAIVLIRSGRTGFHPGLPGQP